MLVEKNEKSKARSSYIFALHTDSYLGNLYIYAIIRLRSWCHEED